MPITSTRTTFFENLKNTSHPQQTVVLFFDMMYEIFLLIFLLDQKDRKNQDKNIPSRTNAFSARIFVLPPAFVRYGRTSWNTISFKSNLYFLTTLHQTIAFLGRH